MSRLTLVADSVAGMGLTAYRFSDWVFELRTGC
jgi:hypothetical protein